MPFLDAEEIMAVRQLEPAIKALIDELKTNPKNRNDYLYQISMVTWPIDGIIFEHGDRLPKIDISPADRLILDAYTSKFMREAS